MSTHHKAPGNFTAGKACESLPHLLSGGRHVLKRGRNRSRKMPRKKMCIWWGPWPGPVTQASPAGSQQCWEQGKGPAAQALCCHLSAGQAPDHSHDSLEEAAPAGAGCPPSSSLPPPSRAPSPLPPSASAPGKTWRHMSHLPKSSSWTGRGRKWNRVSKKVTRKVSGLPPYHVHRWIHRYQEWGKHRPLPPICLTYSQVTGNEAQAKTQSQRNAPKTASAVPRGLSLAT